MTVQAGKSIVYYPGYNQVSVNQKPLLQEILTISNTTQMVVSTVNNHGYNIGLKTNFIIPFIFGMQELNKLTGTIIDTTSNSFTMNIDSSKFTIFAYPSPLPLAYSLPYSVPIGGSSPIPSPLPYGNQDSFEGVVYNNGVQ